MVGDGARAELSGKLAELRGHLADVRSKLRASVPHGLSDDEHERLLERGGKLQFAALAVGAVITGAAFIGFFVWLGA